MKLENQQKDSSVLSQQLKPVTHDIQQNTEEWKELRRRYRCASETSSLIRAGFLNKKNPIPELIKSSDKQTNVQKIIKKLKSNIKGETYIDNENYTSIPAMAHGSRCEDSAVHLLMNKYIPKSINVLNYCSEVISFRDYLASMDVAILTRNTTSPKIYAEIKCPFNSQTSGYMAKSYDTLPKYAQGQVQHQLYVTGVDSLIYFVAVFDQSSNHYRELLKNPKYLIPEASCHSFLVKRDNEFIKEICDMWDRLYEYCMPHITNDSTLNFLSLENKFLEYDNLAAHYSTLRNEYKQKIIEHIPQNSDIMCGEKIVIKKTTKNLTSVNTEKIKEILTPDQIEECFVKKTSESYNIRQL